MHEVYIGKRKFTCASKWEELDGKQLVEIADVLHSPISEAEALIRITLILLRVKGNLWLQFTIVYRLSAEARYDLVNVAKWVLYTNNDCTENKLPVIRTRGSWGFELWGPKRECRGFVFMEFIEADTAYLEFRKSFNNKVARLAALNKLAAVLYRYRNPDMPRESAARPPSLKLRRSQWNGDPREEFNPNLIEYHMKLVSRIPDAYKYAILMFYDACHNAWVEQYPNIFKKVSSEGLSGEDAKTQGSWGNALLSLAGGSINIDKMMKVNAAAALRDLDNKILEQERMEEKLKEQTRQR